MVTIISEEQDIMTDLTMDWLAAEQCPVKRVQDTDFAEVGFTLDRTGTFIQETRDTVSSYWVRRGTENHLPTELDELLSREPNLSSYFYRDKAITDNYVEQQRKQLYQQKHTGSYAAEVGGNKLVNLSLAGAAGLKIPKTCVSNHKSHLRKFLQENHTAITKDMRAPVNVSTRTGRLASTGVTKITLANLDQLADYFAPVLLQEYIEKQFEIRTFIFREASFSMAIFSQNDAQTATDFRNYNSKRPNRCVPFSLPSEITESLLKFMGSANLDTGSIDLIYTPDDDYVFLEVNPMGQFHWLSENCNYYLESFIAQQLSNT